MSWLVLVEPARIDRFILGTYNGALICSLLGAIEPLPPGVPCVLGCVPPSQPSQGEHLLSILTSLPPGPPFQSLGSIGGVSPFLVMLTGGLLRQDLGLPRGEAHVPSEAGVEGVHGGLGLGQGGCPGLLSDGEGGFTLLLFRGDDSTSWSFSPNL